MAIVYAITFLTLATVPALSGFAVGFVAGRENPPQTEVHSR